MREFKLKKPCVLHLFANERYEYSPGLGNLIIEFTNNEDLRKYVENFCLSTIHDNELEITSKAGLIECFDKFDVVYIHLYYVDEHGTIGHRDVTIDENNLLSCESISRITELTELVDYIYERLIYNIDFSLLEDYLEE